MATLTVRIPLKPISWNVLARKHYWEYVRTFDEWKRAVRASAGAMRDGAEERPLIFPVKVTFHCRWKQKRRHDVDSVVAKPVLDELVAMGILPDDSLAYVREASFTGEVGADADEMVVTVEDDEGSW